jgi:hypothetical protein
VGESVRGEGTYQLSPPTVPSQPEAPILAEVWVPVRIPSFHVNDFHLTFNTTVKQITSDEATIEWVAPTCNGSDISSFIVYLDEAKKKPVCVICF